MKRRVFITRDLPGDFDEKLGREFEVEIYEKDEVIPREELLKRIKGMDGVITLLTDKVDKEFFEAAGKSLKVVANYAVGFDNIDVEEATKRGIGVTNTPGVLTEPVGEYVIALMFAVARRVVEGDRFVRAGKYHGWEPNLFLGSSVRGKVMGIIGMGRIGKWTARLACGLGMRTIYYSRSRVEDFELECGVEYKPMDDVLKEADVISISVPLTKKTRGMIGKDELNKMKKTVVLINTSRGPIVDEESLIEVLSKKKISGAGLDVFTDEKNVNPKLFAFNNVVLTPHIASGTVEAREVMAQLATDAVKMVLSGENLDNLVNKEVFGSK